MVLLNINIALCNINMALCNINMALFNINMALLNINMALFNINMALFNINMALFNINRALFNINNALFHIKMALFHINMALFNIMSLFDVNFNVVEVFGAIRSFSSISWNTFENTYRKKMNNLVLCKSSVFSFDFRLFALVFQGVKAMRCPPFLCLYVDHEAINVGSKTGQRRFSCACLFMT